MYVKKVPDINNNNLVSKVGKSLRKTKLFKILCLLLVLHIKDTKLVNVKFVPFLHCTFCLSIILHNQFMYGCIECIYIYCIMYVYNTLYIHRTTTLIGRDLWNHGITMYRAIRNLTIMKLVILLLLNISKHPLVPQLLCLMSCLLASSTCSRGTGEEPMEKHPASPDELIEVKFKDHTFPIFCLHTSQNQK